MEENLSAKISFSFLSIYEKNVTCKRDPEARDRDETETFDFQAETETETFPHFSETETRPRRWENASRDCLETETSRPRLHPCLPGTWPLDWSVCVYVYFNRKYQFNMFSIFISVSVSLILLQQLHDLD